MDVQQVDEQMQQQQLYLDHQNFSSNQMSMMAMRLDSEAQLYEIEKMLRNAEYDKDKRAWVAFTDYTGRSLPPRASEYGVSIIMGLLKMHTNNFFKFTDLDIDTVNNMYKDFAISLSVLLGLYSEDLGINRKERLPLQISIENFMLALLRCPLDDKERISMSTVGRYTETINMSARAPAPRQEQAYFSGARD